MKTLEPLHLDDLLRNFYRTEVPAPWPALTAPADVLPLPKRSSRPSWLRKFSRLALAASVALLLIGYLALASLFPREHPEGLRHDGKLIGNPPGLRKAGDRIQNPAMTPQRGQAPAGKLELIADPIPGGFILTPDTRR